MTSALSIFGIAFAASCIWLGVRIVNRRERWAKPVLAAVVVPAIFAIARAITSNAQVPLFASFGAFALMLFVSIPGTRRDQLRHYLALIVAGALLIVVGSLCSDQDVLAVCGMAVAAFVVLFAGVLSPTAALGSAAQSQTPPGTWTQKAPMPAVRGEVAFEHVTFRYRIDGPEVLHDVNFQVAPGEVIGIVGPSGSGKSTVTRLVQRLYVPENGRVLVDGRDVTGVPVRERNVAMVYQQFINYPSMTVADNIASPLKLRGEKGIGHRVQALAARLHIEPFLARYPAELSGGQQQRVAIARALVTEPQILLADEPTGNLDSKSEREVMQLFHELHKSGLTVIIVTHNQEIADHAQRTIRIRDGLILEEAVA